MRMSMMLCMSLVVMALGLSGCQRITYKTNPRQGIYAGKLAKSASHSFNVQRKQHFLFWGLAPVGVADLNQILKKERQPGQAVADIQITEMNSFVDGLLAYVTYGIYRPRTVSITGKVYNLKGGRQ